MSHSDEEEDFHSADEAGFDEEERLDIVEQAQGPKQGVRDDANREYVNQRCEDKVIKRELSKRPLEQRSLFNNDPAEGSAAISRASSTRTAPNDSQNTGPSTEPVESDLSQEDEDDDEEALVERIRERNLKIARKFSAEIARNLKASAPIPVKTSNSTSHEFSEISDPLDSKSSIQPRAPPSTPALSSSFNNLTDPTAPTAGTSPLNTQYSWRIPPKIASQQSSSGSNTPSKNVKADEQARQVLDRLSERLTQTDKNLFERVAADIKKVSLKKEETPATTDLPSALASITDLGSTLGGWGWSGATKILSSASQVTSQVSSVLDTVVGAPAEEGNSSSSATNRAPDEPTSRDTENARVPRDVTYNDPLVDLTLGAMESLGKKAFGVMTTRDETGSLQIKGLGRPWEHLLSSKKDDRQDEDVSNHQESPRSLSPPPPDYGISEIRSDSPPLPSTLKLRKRRND